MIATQIAVLNPGDDVVIFEPFYENYGPDARLSGAVPRYVPLELDDPEDGKRVVRELVALRRSGIA